MEQSELGGGRRGETAFETTSGGVAKAIDLARFRHSPSPTTHIANMPQLASDGRAGPSEPPSVPKGREERKKGFHVGPAHAPRNAYLGKGQSPLGPFQIIQARPTGPNGGTDNLSARKIKTDLIQRAKMKRQYAKVLKEEGMDSSRLGDGSRRRGEKDSPETVKTRRKGKQRAGENEDDVETREESRRTRALSPRTIGPPMPQTSLRELKKEAFARYHAPRAAAGLGPGKAEGGRGRGGGGQPNMGARMAVLLERIKRDKGS